MSRLRRFGVMDKIAMLRESGAVMALLAQKADGYTQGKNSPLTNPMVDVANTVGKNLFDGKWTANVANGGVVDGRVVYKLDYTSTSIYSTIYVPTTITGQLTFSFYYKKDAASVGNTYVVFTYTDATQTAILLNSTTWTKAILYGTFGKVVSSIQVVQSTDSATTYIDKDTVQLELGPTATTYEPYAKNNALLANFAGTTSDGYSLISLIKSGTMVVGNGLGTTGDFSIDSNSDGLADGLTGASAGTFSLSNGEQTFTPTAQYGKIYATNQLTNVGRTLFICFSVKSTDSTVITFLNGSTTLASNTYDGSNLFKKVARLVTLNSNGLWEIGETTKTSSFVPITVKQAFYVDVTDYPQLVGLTNQQKFDWCLANLENGKTMPFLTADGVDSYGVMANNPSVDITGTEDFAICAGVLTGATIQEQSIVCKGLDTELSSQYYLMMYSDGSVGVSIDGTLIPLSSAGTIVASTLYDIRVYRVGGRLACWINGTRTSERANTASIVAGKPNFRLFARATNSAGTSHSRCFKGSLAWLTLHRGANCTQAKIDRAINAISKDYR